MGPGFSTPTSRGRPRTGPSLEQLALGARLSLASLRPPDTIIGTFARWWGVPPFWQTDSVEDLSFGSVVAVAAIALVAPLLVSLAPRLRVPAVVLEILRRSR